MGLNSWLAGVSTKVHGFLLQQKFWSLALTGVLASGTTFLLYAASARSLSVEDVGQFVLLGTLALFVSQLVDAGQSFDVIRHVRLTALHTSDVAALWRALWISRLRRALLAALIVFTASSFLITADVLLALLAGGLAASSTLYSFAIVQQQATGKHTGTVGLQAANGSLFLVGVVALAPFGGLSVASALAISVVGVGLPGACAAGRQLWAARGAPAGQGHRVQRRSARLLLGTIIGANLDVLLLGAFSATTLAVYAAAQRPTSGLAAIANAVTNHAFTRRSTEPLRIRRAGAAVFAAAGASAVLAAWLLPPLLRPLYDNPNLINRDDLGLLSAAFVVSLAAAVSGPLLTVKGQVGALDAAAWLQVGVLVCGISAAGAWRSATTACVSVLLARSLVLLVHGLALSDHPRVAQLTKVRPQGPRRRS